jgi:hypothetical protein
MAILFIILILELFFIILSGFLKKPKYIELPFLTAVAFFGYLLPQFFSLANDEFISKDGLTKTTLFAILCILLIYCGYYLKKRPSKVFPQIVLSDKKLITSSAILIAVGSFFFHLVTKMAPDFYLEYGGQWSGKITIYVFFSSLLSVGFVIALLLYYKKPTFFNLFLISVSSILYLERIIIEGRRTYLLELGIFFLMARWFQRKAIPSRLLISIFILLGILIVNSIGDYRSVMLEEDKSTWTGAGVEEILNINYLENLEKSFTQNAPDLTNAVDIIENMGNNFDFGAAFYNDFIYRFVPGQIFGAKFKEDLLFNISYGKYAEKSGVQATGTTRTGLAVAYHSFWYLGALIFFIIGYNYSRWYKLAESGNLVAQIYSILLLYPALLALPFSPSNYFISFASLSIFLLPVLLYSKE